MALLHANIPLELKVKPNWVRHKNKIPLVSDTGNAAASNDKATWSDYSKTLYSKHGDGIGFMFEPPYCGIDLDKCIENGKINTYAQGIINALDSYTEYSPSGTGVHIICKGDLPAAIKTPTLEVYQKGRFFTMTGSRISKHSLLRHIDDFSFLYPEGVPNRRSLVERLGNIQEGARNNTLTSLAGSLRAKGFNEQEIYGFLEPKAKEIGFSTDELQNICKSVGRYEVRNVAANGSSIEEFLKELEPVEWIAPGLIARNSIHFVAGLNGTMKTWMLMDLAIECAKEAGGLWLERFPVNHAKVLLIDQERAKGETQRRLQSLISGKSLTSIALKNALFVRCGTSTRLDLQPSFEAFHKEIKELQPDLVIIDSFATFHTKNENLRQEIQIVLEKIKELRNEFKCAFVFIHHENGTAYNKEDDGPPTTGQMSGSEAIPAACEVVFTVRKQGSDSSMIYNTKNTLTSMNAPFLIKTEDLTVDKSKIRCYAY